MTDLPEIVSEVERKLAGFYGFAPRAQAARHLLSREQLKDSLGPAVERLPEFAGRAGVFLSPGGTDDLFIGILLDPSIAATLADRDPMQRLDDANLDAFCMVVEEVSHFHLILNRAGRALGVSKLELEWQGEIDKLLVCAVTLGEQQGDQHLAPLARRLYDSAIITAADHQLYWEATRHAARFWYRALRSGDELTPELRALLRHAYDVGWAEKLARVS